MNIKFNKMEKKRTINRPKGFWTFKGVRLHMKDGSVLEDEQLKSFQLVDKETFLPAKLTKSKNLVREKVHDLLYNLIACGPDISWVELTNIKEYGKE